MPKPLVNSQNLISTLVSTKEVECLRNLPEAKHSYSLSTGCIVAPTGKVRHMGVTVVWDNEEKTALRLDFEGVWTWAKYDQAVDEASAMIEDVGHAADIIHNLLGGPSLPLDKPLLHLRRMVNLLSKNTVFIVVVGGTPPVQAVLSMFFKVFVEVGERLIFAPSLEAARAARIRRHKPKPTNP